jgi:hypothetical protein
VICTPYLEVVGSSLLDVGGGRHVWGDAGWVEEATMATPEHGALGNTCSWWAALPPTAVGLIAVMRKARMVDNAMGDAHTCICSTHTNKLARWINI